MRLWWKVVLPCFGAMLAALFQGAGESTGNVPPWMRFLPRVLAKYRALYSEMPLRGLSILLAPFALPALHASADGAAHKVAPGKAAYPPIGGTRPARTVYIQ